MSKCPFHGDSVGVSQKGEVESIHCSACGDYQISRTALAQLQAQELPQGWQHMVAHRAIVSTRDTRALI